MQERTTMKNVLLLGASGFIGRAVLDTLLDMPGYRIMVLQHRQAVTVQNERLYIIPGSVGSLDLRSLPFPPDLIIHAARNRTGRFGRLGRKLVAFKGRLENLKLLQDAIRLPQPPAIVYCSGSLMYGSSEGLIDEASPLRPESFARQYVTAETPFLDAIAEGSLRIIMLRLPWVIGNGSWFRWNYLDTMEQKGFVPVYGNGGNTMSFVDVAAIGKSILQLYNAGFRGVFNLFHPEYKSQLDWAILLARISGLPLRKLDGGELILFGTAVAEAFATNIRLGSMHVKEQEILRALHRPLEEIASKYLRPLQHKQGVFPLAPEKGFVQGPVQLP